jgi:hypothetical protein
MPHSAAILRILTKAQAELRSMLEQALAESRYTDVAEIARVADSLAQLGADSSQAKPAVEPTVSTSQVPAARTVSAAQIRPTRPSRRRQAGQDCVVKEGPS